MTLWIILAVLTAACVLGIVWPLARPGGRDAAAGSDAEVFKDQLREVDAELERGQIGAREAEASKIEISRRLLAVSGTVKQDSKSAGAARIADILRKPAAAVAIILVPVVALALYGFQGSPQMPDRPHVARAAAPMKGQPVGELIARIEAHLRENRDDARGWAVVAPVYVRMRRYADAAAAYERLLDLRGRDVDTLSAYGEALIMGDQGLVRATANKVMIEAEKLDPLAPKAQFYLGLAELQDGKAKAAAKRWRALLARMSADAPGRATLMEQLRIADSRIAAAGGKSSVEAPALSDEQIAAGQALSAKARDDMIKSMVDRLALRLEKNGGPVGDWLRLARAHKVLGRDGEAAKVLARAEKTFSDDQAAVARIVELRKSLGLDGKSPTPKS